MCSKESIKGRATFNNLLRIIRCPIVPSGMVGRWVRSSQASAPASSLPGHLWGGSVPCLQEMQDKGQSTRLSTSWGRHGSWRGVPLVKGPRPLCCVFRHVQLLVLLFFPSGFKPQGWGGESCTQSTCGWAWNMDWLCRFVQEPQARAAHPSQHTWDMAGKNSLSGFLSSLLCLSWPRLGQKTFPERMPKPLSGPHFLPSLPEQDLPQLHCSVSTSRSSGWRWESFVSKAVENWAQAFCTWPKLLVPSTISCTTPMQERAKFKLKCLWYEEELPGLCSPTALPWSVKRDYPCVTLSCQATYITGRHHVFRAFFSLQLWYLSWWSAVGWN